MAKLNNSDFETLDSIIKSIDFNYTPEETDKLAAVEKMWTETVGENIAKMTKVLGLTNGLLKISCCDSYVSNELYNAKMKLLEIMASKTSQTEINISDIKFEYKSWKNQVPS